MKNRWDYCKAINSNKGTFSCVFLSSTGCGCGIHNTPEHCQETEIKLAAEKLESPVN